MIDAVKFHICYMITVFILLPPEMWNVMYAHTIRPYTVLMATIDPLTDILAVKYPAQGIQLDNFILSCVMSILFTRIKRAIARYTQTWGRQRLTWRNGDFRLPTGTNESPVWTDWSKIWQNGYFIDGGTWLINFHISNGVSLSGEVVDYLDFVVFSFESERSRPHVLDNAYFIHQLMRIDERMCLLDYVDLSGGKEYLERLILGKGICSWNFSRISRYHYNAW